MAETYEAAREHLGTEHGMTGAEIDACRIVEQYHACGAFDGTRWSSGLVWALNGEKVIEAKTWWVP